MKKILALILASSALFSFSSFAQNCNTVYGAGWQGSGSSVGVQSYGYATNTWDGSSLESVSYFTSPNTINNGGPIAIDPLNQVINLVTDASPMTTAIFTFGSVPTFVTFPSSLNYVTAQLLCSGYKPSSHVCYYMSQYFLSTSPTPSNTGFFSIDFTDLSAPVAKSYTAVLAPGSPLVNTTNGGDICFDANGTGYLVTAADQLYTVVTDENALTATFTYIASLALPFQATAIAFDPMTPNSLTITSGFTPHYSNYNLSTNAITILTTNAGWIAGDLASCVYPNLKPALSVNKSIYDITQASAPPVIIGTNDIIQYTVTVKNTGNVNAGDFMVTDTVPAGVAYVPGSTTMNGIAVADGPGGAFPFATGALANSGDQAYGSGILTTYATAGNPDCVIKYEVKVTAASGATVVNLATASATGSSPTEQLINSAKASFNVDIMTLAVSLLDFNASQKQSAVLLDWAVTGAANSGASEYEVERSTDGTNFSVIGNVSAIQANMASDPHYSFTDAKPAMGNDYYRLKQLNEDGTYAISPVQLIKFSGAASPVVKVYPNPARASAITVSMDGSYQQVNVRVLNITGQARLQNAYSNVNSNITVDISSLTKGIYLVSVIADGSAMQPTKLIVD